MGNTSSTQDSDTNTNAIDEKKKKIEVMKEEIKKEVEVLTKEIGVVEKDKKKKMEVMEEEMRKKVEVMDEEMKKMIEVTEEEIKKKMAVMRVLEKEMRKEVEVLKEKKKKKIKDLEEELKKKIEVLEEEMKKNKEKSAVNKTKKGQSRGAETSKSKPSRSQDCQGAVLNMRQEGVGMGPSSKREVKKEEIGMEQTGGGGTFEERRVDALEGLADSVEKLVRVVMAVLIMWL